MSSKKCRIDVGPNDNPTNEPEPDIIVLKREFSSFASANPGPEDLRLAVEIAYSTIDFDLTTKAALAALKFPNIGFST